MPVPEPVGLRRAALAVYALSLENRARLYALLGDEHAKRLRPLIAELEQLGIPRELASQNLDACEHIASIDAVEDTVGEAQISLLIRQSLGTLTWLQTARPQLARAARERLSPAQRMASVRMDDDARPGVRFRNAMTREFARQAQGAVPESRHDVADGMPERPLRSRVDHWWLRTKRLWRR
jgi:hypothetical protein